MKNQSNKATVKDGLPTADETFHRLWDCFDDAVGRNNVLTPKNKHVLKDIIEEHTSLHTQALKQRVKELEGTVSELRTAFANYWVSEGCSCCRDSDNHRDAEHAIGELLGVAKHDDESGYDFNQYQTIYK